MRFPKNVLTLAMVLILCCSAGMIMPASATEIQPLYLATLDASADLKISSRGTATCSIRVQANLCSQSIEATTTLYRIDNSTDTPVASWFDSMNHIVSNTQTCGVSKGYNYQLRSYITIKNSSGGVIESFWKYSNVIYY